MKITKVYNKVRKWSNPGKTSIPNGKSLPENWSPSCSQTEVSESMEFTPSCEFSADFSLGDLPAMPLSIIEDDASEEKGEERQFYLNSPRLVCFDEDVLVRRVRPVYLIGGKISRRQLWYQDDEYKEMMWKARKLVKRALNDDENTNSEKYCLRGLEHVSNSVSRRTKKNLDGREAVLNEQCNQFKKDVFPLDDNKIAAVYLPYTRSDRKEAFERAKCDAEEVELYQQSPTPTSSSRTSRTSAPIPSNSSHSSHSSLQLQTPKSQRKTLSSSSSSPFTSPKSPGSVSPSLVNKPGMMFTYIDKTIQYPAAMKLESI